MKLNVSGLLKEPGAKEDFAFVLEQTPEAGDIAIIEPIRVRGFVVNTGRLLELQARVETKARTSCARCLEDVEIPLDFEFQDEYSPDREEAGEQAEAEAEGAVLYFQDDTIDISQAVRDNLLLNLPMVILCSRDCPGLCPRCGKHLKEGPCNCQSKEVDPRLAVLAKLKEK